VAKLALTVAPPSVAVVAIDVHEINRAGLEREAALHRQCGAGDPGARCQRAAIADRNRLRRAGAAKNAAAIDGRRGIEQHPVDQQGAAIHRRRAAVAVGARQHEGARTGFRNAAVTRDVTLGRLRAAAKRDGAGVDLERHHLGGAVDVEILPPGRGWRSAGAGLRRVAAEIGRRLHCQRRTVHYEDGAAIPRAAGARTVIPVAALAGAETAQTAGAVSSAAANAAAAATTAKAAVASGAAAVRTGRRAAAATTTPGPAIAAHTAIVGVHTAAGSGGASAAWEERRGRTNAASTPGAAAAWRRAAGAAVQGAAAGTARMGSRSTAVATNRRVVGERHAVDRDIGAGSDKQSAACPETATAATIASAAAIAAPRPHGVDHQIGDGDHRSVGTADLDALKARCTVEGVVVARDVYRNIAGGGGQRRERTR